MKMHVYLSIVSSVLLLGFALTYFRDKTDMKTTVSSNNVALQPFQSLGEQYARKTRTGPIAEWMVYGGIGAAVMADGIDSEGRQVIKCVFDKVTGSPLTLMRAGWQGVDLSDVPKNNPRKAAAWWLKHVVPPNQGEWHWVRNVLTLDKRYLSIWQCKDYKASLSVHPPTGRFIALRLSQRIPSHASVRMQVEAGKKEGLDY